MDVEVVKPERKKALGSKSGVRRPEGETTQHEIILKDGSQGISAAAAAAV